MSEHREGNVPLLEVDDLVVRFPLSDGRVVHAVEKVSFSLREGETLGLVGESGSGKSTIGFTIVKRYDPVSGSIRFAGRQVEGIDGDELHAFRRRVQMVFQDPFSSLNPRMKVLDVVTEPLVVHGVERRSSALRERARELVIKCGLPGEAIDKYPGAFSGGERQRIAIARALALNPRLIIADEAVSALDVSIQAQVINLLEDLQRDHGIAYLFISHNLAVVRHIADRLLILYAGKTMEIGDSAAIFAEPCHPYTQALLSASPVADPGRERRRRRIVLKGEIPDVIQPPEGCRFASRCPLADMHCWEKEPPLARVGPGRWSACWKVDQARAMNRGSDQSEDNEKLSSIGK